MDGLTIFFLFVTAWIAIATAGIVLFRFITRPKTTGCCLNGPPCSAKCARQLQEMRDRLSVAYDKVVREIGVIVTAGAELVPSAARDPGGRAEDLSTPAGTAGRRA